MEKELTWEIIRDTFFYDYCRDMELVELINKGYRRLKSTECPQNVDDAMMTFEDELNKIVGLPLRQ